MRYTTKAYREAALETMLAEINRTSVELGLPEKRPLQAADLREVFIESPFLSEHARRFACVKSKMFSYSAAVDNKLCYIARIFNGGEAERRMDLADIRAKYTRPKAQVNTNSAHALALRWLSAAQIDVAALERDTTVDIRAWNFGDKFAPLYWVRWFQISEPRRSDRREAVSDTLVASVELLEPEQALRNLSVNKGQYIKRRPLAVPNRDALLQRTDDPEVAEMWSTTPAYKNAATEALLKEVNESAKELNLHEVTPLSRSVLTEANIETPFFSDHQGRFGTICTTNYVYGANAGNKLSYIRRNFRYQDESAFRNSIMRHYLISKNQIDTRSAREFAIKVLADASVDVKSLEHDCEISITPWETDNGIVPLYTLVWTKGTDQTAATVELLLPERLLVCMWVSLPQYIKRKSLVVSNREKLLQRDSREGSSGRE